MKSSVALATLLFIFFSKSAMGQIEVGYYHDLDGLPIHGYVDTYQYSPNKQLRFTYSPTGFEKGTLYMNDGTTKEGLIKPSLNKLYFKENADSKKKSIVYEQVNGMRMGIDSFFIDPNFTGHPSERLIQYISSSAKFDFAKIYQFGAGEISSVKYAAKEKDKTRWDIFPKTELAYMPYALKYFGEIPLLKTKLDTRTDDFMDVEKLINLSRYHHAHLNRTPIYFDQFWNETLYKTESTFQAEIDSFVNDSLWTMTFYQGNRKLYQATYSSLFPHVKEGTFIVFSDEGKSLSTSEYKENELKSRTVFYQNGKKHYEYQYLELTSGDQKPFKVAEYIHVYDTSGNDLVKDGQWVETIKFDRREYINEFNKTEGGKGAVLTRSFRESQDGKVYQVIGHGGYNFKEKRLQTLLTTHLNFSDLSALTNPDVSGTYFASVVLSSDGDITDLKFVNHVHPELDQIMNQWLYKTFSNSPGPYSIKLKPYLVNNEKVNAEFIIPVTFNVRKFYREPADYYWNLRFHHMMQMHTPSFPSGF